MHGIGTRFMICLYAGIFVLVVFFCSLGDVLTRCLVEGALPPIGIAGQFCVKVLLKIFPRGQWSGIGIILELYLVRECN